jgi:hypothetical protein
LSVDSVLCSAVLEIIWSGLFEGVIITLSVTFLTKQCNHPSIISFMYKALVTMDVMQYHAHLVLTACVPLEFTQDTAQCTQTGFDTYLNISFPVLHLPEWKLHNIDDKSGN